MSTITTERNTHHELTFADLKGLRAEGYIRDSTRDQKDGFGPELQHKSIETFSNTYGLNLGTAYYTDFITGTSTLKRSGFNQALSDARKGNFDVLLIYHTSRFARNRADAIRYKMELKKLGKILVFISQNIISGRNTDFLNEGINEILDEQYSRNLSKWVTDGLSLKHDSGMANGKPPLGYKSEKSDTGKRERKVPNLIGIGGDPKKGGMEALIALLRVYSTGRYSYELLAEHLTACGYRTRLGEPFTKGGVEHVLKNSFYEGKAVFHPNKSDEHTEYGKHEVPDEVKELWMRCQDVRRQRSNQTEGRPRLLNRSYVFSKVASCDQCGSHYGGQPSHRNSGRVIRRLSHARPFCDLTPHSIRVENLITQFQDRVLPYIKLNGNWKNMILNSISTERNFTSQDDIRVKIKLALKNLRKQHMWGDLDDAEYRQEKQELERQENVIPMPVIHADSLNLDRAGKLLSEVGSLWEHPGVSDLERESLIKELFEEMHLRGSNLVSIKPKPQYLPLFACIVTEGVRKYRGERI